MKNVALILLPVLIFVFFSRDPAQSNPPAAPVRAPDSAPSNGRDMNQAPLISTPRDPYRLGDAPAGSGMSPFLKKETKEKLKISDQEKDSLRQNLSDKKVNFLRLLSGLPCEGRNTVDVSDPRCSGSIENWLVSHYSFRLKEYMDSVLTDIQLSQGFFAAGNVRHCQGFLIDLGDTEFGKVDMSAGPVAALLGMPKIKTLKEEAQLSDKLDKGFKVGDQFISHFQKAQLNHTYLLRSVTYHVEGDGMFWYNLDTMIVFRVVKLDTDNTATLVWKKLAEKESPTLKSDKSEHGDKPADN